MKNMIEVKLRDGSNMYVSFSSRQLLLDVIEMEKEGIPVEDLSAFDKTGKEQDISPCNIVEVK